jgi:single-strand DNA-binding protein
MSNINEVIVSGNVTRDPEFRETNGGASIMNFGIAVNDYVKSGDYTNFFDVTMFGLQADALADIIKKGMKLTIHGKLRYSSWENNDGTRRSKVEIIGKEVELPPRGDSGDSRDKRNYRR